jgi:hypothetical protein
MPPLSNPNGYSAGDIDGILRPYGAIPTQVTVTSNPPGLQVIVDGSTVTTHQTYAWALNVARRAEGETPSGQPARCRRYSFSAGNHLAVTDLVCARFTNKGAATHFSERSALAQIHYSGLASEE